MWLNDDERLEFRSCTLVGYMLANFGFLAVMGAWGGLLVLIVDLAFNRRFTAVIDRRLLWALPPALFIAGWLLQRAAFALASRNGFGQRRPPN